MKLCSYEHCCGCGACASICPFGAIKMVQDERGFMRPQFDKSKCKNCGLCDKVTSLLENDKFNKSSIRRAYALRLKSDNERMRSQSGGLFFGIAKKILKNKGVVYGCLFDERNIAIHKRVDNFKELEALRGSKYVQSDLKNTYIEVVKDLKEGRCVLFSGTPCYIDGLIKFLEIKSVNMDNLYTCDIICHGVPSPLLYEDFKVMMEKKYKSKIKKINLRDKSCGGWSDHIESIEFENGKKYEGIIFRDLFYRNLPLRKSCEVCKYANKARKSDITMADCWGFKEKYPDKWNDNKGISLCLINSPKGEKLFSSIKSQFEYMEVLESTYMQPQLKGPSLVPDCKEEFWDYYKDNGFKKALIKYTDFGEEYRKKKAKKEEIRRKIIRFPRRVLGKIKRTMIRIIKIIIGRK